MKTLYLEKRGCDFFANDEITNASDVTNYRVCTPAECITGKNGKTYFLEFTRYVRWHYRRENTRTGKPLKKPVKVIDNKNALWVNTQFSEIEEGGRTSSWGDLETEAEIRNKNLDFTLAGILEAVNSISIEKYDKIEFINR